MEHPPPSFFLNKMKNSSYYLKFWFIFVFFQNVDIRSRRRNLFWFYVKMHKIQDYSWWSDSKTKITNYWSFSLVKRKKSSQNFQIAKRRKGGWASKEKTPIWSYRKIQKQYFSYFKGTFFFFDWWKFIHFLKKVPYFCKEIGGVSLRVKQISYGFG